MRHRLWGIMLLWDSHLLGVSCFQWIDGWVQRWCPMSKGTWRQQMMDLFLRRERIKAKKQASELEKKLSKDRVNLQGLGEEEWANSKSVFIWLKANIIVIFKSQNPMERENFTTLNFTFYAWRMRGYTITARWLNGFTKAAIRRYAHGLSVMRFKWNHH